jgi:hypothetical protein
MTTAPRSRRDTPVAPTVSSATERPDPRPCSSCSTSEASCQSRRLFSGRRCCSECQHETIDESQAAS